MYLLTFTTSVLCLYAAEKNIKPKSLKHIFILVALLIPSLLAGFRDYSIGQDVLLYGNVWFEKAVRSDSFVSYMARAYSSKIGYGYGFINYIVSLYTTNPHVFYGVFEFIQMVVLYFALRPFKDKISIPFAFFIYYFLFYNNSLNILRQSLALVLVLFSLQFVMGKKPIKFINIIILAFIVHSSAFIGVLLYPMGIAMQSGLKRLYKALIVLTTTGMIFMYPTVLNLLMTHGVLAASRYEHYLTDDTSGGRIIRLAFWGFLFCLFLWRRMKCSIIFPQIDLLFLCCNISLLMSLTGFMGSARLIRISYYFDIMNVIYLPLIAKTKFTTDPILKRKSSYALIFSFVFVYWLIVYVIRNGGVTYPYMFRTY